MSALAAGIIFCCFFLQDQAHTDLPVQADPCRKVYPHRDIIRPRLIVITQVDRNRIADVKCVKQVFIPCKTECDLCIRFIAYREVFRPIGELFGT